MPVNEGPGLLVAGSFLACFTPLWLSDYRGIASVVLRSFYSRFGGWLWPSGGERSYVAFNRFVGGALGLAISLVAVGFGITQLVQNR